MHENTYNLLPQALQISAFPTFTASYYQFGHTKFYKFNCAPSRN